MIRIDHQLSLADDEIQETFVCSSGPGGQNVNKVATAVQLRFDIRNSPSLPDDIKSRLVRIAGNAVNRQGVLTITARRYRSQGQNRKDARDRLLALIRSATRKPKPHKKPKVPYGSRMKRLEYKRRRGEQKSMRHPVHAAND